MDDNTRALILIAIIGLIAGWLAYLILPGDGNILKYFVSGILGSFVGGYLLNALGVNLGIGNRFLTQIVTATIGAIVVIVLARILI